MELAWQYQRRNMRKILHLDSKIISLHPNVFWLTPRRCVIRVGVAGVLYRFPQLFGNQGLPSGPLEGTYTPLIAQKADLLSLMASSSGLEITSILDRSGQPIELLTVILPSSSR